MLTAALLLVSRMAIVAAIVMSVSVIVARSGPVVGAMLAAMPISAGPSYVFLALDYPPEFIVRSTISSILAASATSAFVVAHWLVSRVAGTLVCLLAALGAFLLAVTIANLFTWTLPGAALAGTVALVLAIVATRQARREAVPFALPPRRIDLVVRALAVMSVVATVTILAALFGARAAGYGALIPVVFTSFVVLIQGSKSSFPGKQSRGHGMPEARSFFKWSLTASCVRRSFDRTCRSSPARRLRGALSPGKLSPIAPGP